MSVFDRLNAIANRAIDYVNAEPFVLVPMRSTAGAPNGRAVRAEDSERPTIEGTAVFDNVSVEAGIQLGVRKSYRESNDLRALQVGREPIASIDIEANFPTRESLPRQGDVIYFPEQPDGPAYEIVSGRPDGHGRIVLRLVIRGPRPAGNFGDLG